MAIAASVGRGGINAKADVRQVQQLLNRWLAATNQPQLPVDGGAGPRTIGAIEAYQARVLGADRPDGRVDPGGRTWRALAAGEGAVPPLSGGAVPSPAASARQVRPPGSTRPSGAAAPSTRA